MANKGKKKIPKWWFAQFYANERAAVTISPPMGDVDVLNRSGERDLREKRELADIAWTNLTPLEQESQLVSRQREKMRRNTEKISACIDELAGDNHIVACGGVSDKKNR
jgi:hypothetical protein